MSAGRFSKSNLLKDLQTRADYIAVDQGFSNRTGYAQLGDPPRGKEAREKWLGRAMKYGRWQELLMLIDCIKLGEIGTGE